MSVSTQAAYLQATNLFIQGHLDESLKLYSELISSKSEYNLMINRCIAFIQKNDYESALKDANLAIELNSNNYEGYFYRGIPLFSLGKYEDAFNDFNEALKLNAPQKMMDRWIFRCNSEISNKKIKSIEQNNEEESKKAELKEAGPQKHHIYSKTGRLAYSWFQTDKTVGISLDYRVKDRKQLKYKLEEDKIDVSFPIDGSKDYNLSITLWSQINTEVSKVLPGLETIDITLEKKIPSLNWEQLTKDEIVEAEMTENENKAPLYPTSAHQKKDWNKIDKEAEEELRKDQEKYGDARKGLIEALYNNSDEQQRMALMKSVQGSHGCYM